MRRIRILAAAVLPLLLAACFLLPGKFASTLDVRRDGHFDFTYKGEIVLANTAELMGGGRFPEFKPDPNQPCYGPVGSGRPRIFVPPPAPAATMAAPPPIVATPPAPPPSVAAPPRPSSPSALTFPTVVTPSAARKCTAAEIDQRNADYARSRALERERQQREGERFTRLIGLNPNDEGSMREFAALLQKQQGWRSAVYKGNGVFLVDYRETGTLDRDFIFPLFPRANFIMPFVVVRKRADGAVQVTAPGFVSNPAQGLMDEAKARAASGAMPPGGGPDGVFTLTSDTPALTNNTEDGPSLAGGRSVMMWRVSVASTKVPEALLPLPR